MRKVDLVDIHVLLNNILYKDISIDSGVGLAIRSMKG